MVVQPGLRKMQILVPSPIISKQSLPRTERDNCSRSVYGIVCLQYCHWIVASAYLACISAHTHISIACTLAEIVAETSSGPDDIAIKWWPSALNSVHVMKVYCSVVECVLLRNDERKSSPSVQSLSPVPQSSPSIQSLSPVPQSSPSVQSHSPVHQIEKY